MNKNHPLIVSLVISVTIVFSSIPALASDPVSLLTGSLIPEPHSIVPLGGGEGVSPQGIKGFVLTGDARVPAVAEKYLSKVFRRPGKGTVQLVVDGSVEDDEAYVLRIGDGKVEIRASSQKGLDYGTTTLLQILQNASELSIPIPAMEIKDGPDSRYRAVHIDLKSHSVPYQYLYDIVDFLAMYKINGIVVEFEDKIEYREHPDIVFRVALDYTSRDDISIRLGVSGKGSDTSPMYEYPSSIVYNQGGDYPMQGQYDDSAIEIAIDFSQYADKVAEMPEPNYFLTVTRSKFGNVLGEGTIESFSVYDFRENPDDPAVYTCEGIDSTPLAEGKNVFNIPTVEPDRCSYSPVQWINTLTGQPVAAPFVFRTADGKYAKVRFSDYDRENGTIRIRYVYAADGSHNLK